MYNTQSECTQRNNRNLPQMKTGKTRDLLTVVRCFIIRLEKQMPKH